MLYIVKVHSTWTVSLHLCACRGSTSGEYGKRRAGGGLRQPLRVQVRLGVERAPRAAKALPPRHRVRRPPVLSLSFSTLHFSSSSILLFFYSSLLYSHSLSSLLSSADAKPGSGAGGTEAGQMRGAADVLDSRMSANSMQSHVSSARSHVSAVSGTASSHQSRSTPASQQ